ncbi:hypothetical protein H072_2139 [Dactylellina haptotyla CBS 200.50]|uniref:Uncharacterized protein n=1 Tax=Dactylellina haptotyla (strain CBS 200.50) TaxID=1284197 RepID=S8ALN8_DACHA|nr:hypothetical protein H072_2139 [Dactylellina haptotyla CBS 200.50]
MARHMRIATPPPPNDRPYSSLISYNGALSSAGIQNQAPPAAVAQPDPQTSPRTNGSTSNAPDSTSRPDSSGAPDNGPSFIPPHSTDFLHIGSWTAGQYSNQEAHMSPAFTHHVRPEFAPPPSS